MKLQECSTAMIHPVSLLITYLIFGISHKTLHNQLCGIHIGYKQLQHSWWSPESQLTACLTSTLLAWRTTVAPSNRFNHLHEIWWTVQIVQFIFLFWFQASAAMLIKCAVFWGITRRRVVIVYRRFRTTYRSHPHRCSDSWPMRMGLICCPETSVNNYHTTPCNTPEDCRFYLSVSSSLSAAVAVDMPWTSAVSSVQQTSVAASLLAHTKIWGPHSGVAEDSLWCCLLGKQLFDSQHADSPFSNGRQSLTTSPLIGSCLDPVPICCEYKHEQAGLNDYISHHKVGHGHNVPYLLKNLM
jgi:hypothetical protein